LAARIASRSVQWDAVQAPRRLVATHVDGEGLGARCRGASESGEAEGGKPEKPMSARHGRER
jgi:hypothetical protein